jgi:hypothetical protein
MAVMSMLPQIFNGTLREHYLLLFGMAGGIAAVVGFIAAWVGAHFGARRAARLGAEAALANSGLGIDRTLGSLVQAVDAIALEVERLSEGQRFTARLMSERPSLGVPSKQENPARVITPH